MKPLKAGTAIPEESRETTLVGTTLLGGRTVMTPNMISTNAYGSNLRKNQTMSADQLKFNLYGIRNKLKKGITESP